MLSLSDIPDKHRVMFNADKEKALRVHFPRKVVKFKQLSNSLWRLMPSDTSNCIELPMDPNKGLNFTCNAVNDNLKCFSEQMKKRSSKDRKLCIASGAPNFTSFKATMRMNLI